MNKITEQRRRGLLQHQDSDTPTERTGDRWSLHMEEASQSGGMPGEPDPAVVPSSTHMVIHPLQDTGTGCFYP